ncbi:hypothetical protein DFH06DRAFT_1130873 [Mycena polygramma]|nr:hypothetical protein DFH06DRAFT_1130873 [Mycena polygramma]
MLVGIKPLLDFCFFSLQIGYAAFMLQNIEFDVRNASAVCSKLTEHTCPVFAHRQRSLGQEVDGIRSVGLDGLAHREGMEAPAADRARFADIEAEIQKLKQSIRELRSEQDSIRARLESRSYPVLTLPNELVSEIFIHFLPIYPSCPPLTGDLSPYTLLWICSKWREIALSTPALWRAMSLDYMDDDEAQVQMVQASGSYPLSIEAHQEMCIEGELLQALARHCSRWEHVKLHLTLSDLPGGTSLPMLRQLELQVPLRSDSPFREALSPVPLLRAAALWDFNCPSDLLPWSQLTSLIFIARYPSDCTPILQQAVNLVHCELILFAEQHPQPDIHLPCLKSLIIAPFSANHEDFATADYLLRFIVPGLRRLQIAETFIVPDPIARLMTFVKRSQCKLKELHVTGERSFSTVFYRKKLPNISVITFNRQLRDWLTLPAVGERRSMEDFEEE